MGNSIELTKEQKKSLNELVAGVGYGGAPILVDRPNEHLRVFVAAFDGTMNDRDSIPKGEVESLVADFERKLKDSDKRASVYYEGVGTRANFFDEKVESATGRGSLERAERAYADLVKQTDAWRKEDPNVQVHVHTASFSRGGGSALHFLNMVDKRGIETLVPVPKEQSAGTSAAAAEPALNKLGPGKVLSSATLIDTVVTGQHGTLDLGLPKTTVSVLQVVAELEHRRAFSFSDTHDPARTYELARISGVDVKMEGRWNLVESADKVISVTPRDTSIEYSPTAVSAYQRITTLTLPGVHSDAGGTYGDGGLRDVSKYLVDKYHRDLGFAVEVTRPSAEHIATSFAHDSRWPIDKRLDDLLGEHQRGHIDKPVARWDGTAEYLYQIGDRYGMHIEADTSAPGEGLKIPVGGFAVPHCASIALSDAGELVIKQDGPKTLGYDPTLDRVTVHGQPLEFLGDKAHLTQYIIQNDGPIHLSVTAKKHLADFVIKDGPNDQAPLGHPRQSALALDPKEALADVLSDGLRQLRLDPQAISPETLANTLIALKDADREDRLVLRADGEVSISNFMELRADPPGKGDIVLDVGSLRDAIGVERLHVASQSQDPSTKPAAPAMEM